MLKIHVKQNDAWLPVFAVNNGKIVTCQNCPDKALPPKAIWAKDDLLYFQSKFANHEFCLKVIWPSKE